MLAGFVLPIAAAVLSLGYLGSEYALVLACSLVLSAVACTWLFQLWLRRKVAPVAKGTIGFFHPYAHGGGGGERVLWCAVQALQQHFPTLKLILFVEEGFTAEELVQRAATTFNLVVESTFEVLPVQNVNSLNPKNYPRFTLLGQAIGSVKLAFQAFQQVVPEVFLDTTGFAFTYPLARLAGSRVSCYVHYPTVNADMLQRVQSRQAFYNNDLRVSSSPVLSSLKVVYYFFFSVLYGLVGGCAAVVMVNSTWTFEHIAKLWWRFDEPILVYPPCDTQALQALPLDRKLKRLYLISVAQFRPEKNHELQLEAYALAREHALANPSAAGEAVLSSQLVLLGGCRNEDERALLEGLQQLASTLNIHHCCRWHVSADFEELKMLLAGAVGGLHSMVDEHFGISIVEYMAAGVVPIVHNSGGPKKDIVLLPEQGPEPGERSGYVCSNLQEYVEAITEVLAMGQVERLRIAAAARRHAAKFSDDCFKQHFLLALQPVLPKGLPAQPLGQ